MARIKDKSVRDVVDASNIVEVVGLRTSLRKSSGTRYMGRCPFHEERSASFSVNSDLNLYHCFGCGKGGDVVTFVRETEGLDFVGAIEWLAERFRIPLEYEESSPAGRRGPEAPRAPLRGSRSGGVVLRAPPLGRRRRGARARVSREPRPRRGDLEGVPARPLAGQRPRGEGAREGIHGRGAARCRADEPARQRLLPAAAHVPARRRARQGDRLPGAQAPRRRPAEGQVRQLAGERPLQEEQRPLRPPPRAPRDREAGPRRRGRGQHRRDRAAAGGVRARGRVDGHRAHRAAPARARPADEAPVSLLRRRRGRRGGDAARHGAGARPGLRDPGRRVAARPGSGRCPDGLRAAARPGRELPPLPRPARARARRRSPGGIRSRARDPVEGGGLARSARRRSGSSPTGSTCRARRSPGSRRRGARRRQLPARA